MDALAALLMTWIAENSDYRTAHLPVPAIVEMSPQELTREAYKDNPKMLPDGGIDDRILALYSFEDGAHGTIFVLGAKWTDDGSAPDLPPQSDPVFQERVLHELVHHVQRVTGAYDRFPCRNFGEREAYDLGGKFLKQRHARDPLPNRVFWATIYSRC